MRPTCYSHVDESYIACQFEKTLFDLLMEDKAANLRTSVPRPLCPKVIELRKTQKAVVLMMAMQEVYCGLVIAFEVFLTFTAQGNDYQST